MKHYYPTLTLILFLLSFGASAQSNYKPGYVIDLKGDTIKGFIDYREWSICPDTIKFKKAATDESSLYGVNEIGYFNVDGVDEYRKFTVTISNSEIDPNKLEYLKDTTLRTATVFLRVLQQGGKVTLYSYTDKLKTRYYIGEGSNVTPKELIYQTYLDPHYDDPSNSGGRTSRTITENTFRRQLNAVALKYNM
ncbi:MAG TPA: hypothetical protein VHS53_13670, partial [Mucilaginibacter sp.]|nr:hypothetical protein [Mucilaginibacter sp.]